MTALRDSGELVLWTVLAVVGLFAIVAIPALLDDGWHALLNARARHPRTPTPPPLPLPTESEAPMTEAPFRRDEPFPPADREPAPAAPAPIIDEVAKREQDLAEAEAKLVKANHEALFADHDHAAMTLRITAMERELERLGLARSLASRAAETAEDHVRDAEFTFLQGKYVYEIPEYEESLHTHRRWRMLEQAKASSLSRGFEARALQTAVEKMTLEIEKTKDTAPYRAATASRTREAAEKARERVEAARERVEAARAAAEQPAPRKPTPPADDSQP